MMKRQRKGREKVVNEGLSWVTKFVKTPKKCKNCKRTLKNTKAYYLGNKRCLANKFWTFEKVCKRCGCINVSDER